MFFSPSVCGGVAPLDCDAFSFFWLGLSIYAAATLFAILIYSFPFYDLRITFCSLGFFLAARVGFCRAYSLIVVFNVVSCFVFLSFVLLQILLILPGSTGLCCKRDSTFSPEVCCSLALCSLQGRSCW